MRNDLPDYRLEPPEAPDPPACPICGSTMYSEIFLNGNDVLGCDYCVRVLDAAEWWEDLEAL